MKNFDEINLNRTKQWTENKESLPSLLAVISLQGAKYLYLCIQAARHADLYLNHAFWSDDTWFDCYQKGELTNWFESLDMDDLTDEDSEIVADTLTWWLENIFGGPLPDELKAGLQARAFRGQPFL